MTPPPPPSSSSAPPISSGLYLLCDGLSGASGQTGQWVTTDLLSKGFNVRAFVRKLERAEDLFGFDGANLDIFEGDVRNLESLKEAMRWVDRLWRRGKGVC